MPHLPGAPWRDLPPDYGHWNTTAHRFRRWQKNGQWAKLIVAVSDDIDFELMMIDARYVKAHQYGAGWWAAIRPCPGPKGAEYQAAPGSGRPRNAGSYGGNGRDGGGLHAGGGVD